MDEKELKKLKEQQQQQHKQQKQQQHQQQQHQYQQYQHAEEEEEQNKWYGKAGQLEQQVALPGEAGGDPADGSTAVEALLSLALTSADELGIWRQGFGELGVAEEGAWYRVKSRDGE